MSHRNFLNRRRWSIEQRRKVLAQSSRDFIAEQAQKLEQLRTLAAALESLPHYGADAGRGAG